MAAQGWRLDFESLKISKTGGIFIKTSVPGVKIYVNDEYQKSTGSLLSYNALIEGLLPKNYNVFVYKENFYPWNKTIEVRSGLVAAFKSVILFPLELQKIKVAELPPAATTTTSNISPDGGKSLLISGREIGIVYLKDFNETNPPKKSKDTEFIAAAESTIDYAEWLSDSEHVFWLSGGSLNVAEIDGRGGKRNMIKFFLNVAPPFFFDRETNSLYYFEKKILYKISLTAN